MKEDYERKLEEMSKDHEKKIETSNVDHDTKLQEMMTENQRKMQEDYERKLEASKVDHEKTLQDMAKENQKRIKEHDTKLHKMLEEMQKKVKTEYEQKLEASNSKLKEDYDSKLQQQITDGGESNQAAENEIQRLKKLNESGKREHEEALKRVRTSFLHHSHSQLTIINQHSNIGTGSSTEIRRRDEEEGGCSSNEI